MKKSKLSLGLMACLLSVGSLAGCDKIKSSSDGVLLYYTIDGVKQPPITADQILGDYYNDSTKYQAIFDTIYSVIARNYFAEERELINYFGTPKQLGKSQMAEIEAEAEDKRDDDIETAYANADENNTRFKKEFEKILEEKGVKTKEELLDKYIEELQKEKFEENFYTYYIDTLKEGAETLDLGDGKTFTWTGYFKDQVPFHMSHIMVELADTSDTSYTDGTISQENAEKA